MRDMVQCFYSQHCSILFPTVPSHTHTLSTNFQSKVDASKRITAGLASFSPPYISYCIFHTEELALYPTQDKNDI